MNERLSAITLSTLALLSMASVAHAGDWQKSYTLSPSSKPSIWLHVGDVSTTVRSCDDCRSVRITVEWRDRRPSDYTLSESQTGNHVNFELRERAAWGVHFNIGGHNGARVTVETPSAVDLDARSGDGSLSVSGLQGFLQVHTGDGSLDISDSGGALHIIASDGSVRVHNAFGTVDSRSSDGSTHIDGNFSGVQVKTGDGSLDFTFAEGSKLTMASRIDSSDGSVRVRLPRSLAADLEVHTGDGRIDCQVPLTTQGYNSRRDSRHELRGRLNGGGVPLVIHAQDAGVTISAL